MIEALGAGLHAVSGELTFATAARVREAGLAVIRPGATVTFDLGAVTRADSAALALVVDWMRAGAAAGVQVRLRSVPAALRDLARVCDADDLLPELGAA